MAMYDLFFDEPILNSPYGFPDRHWELAETGRQTINCIVESKRRSELITLVPKPKITRVTTLPMGLISTRVLV